MTAPGWLLRDYIAHYRDVAPTPLSDGYVAQLRNAVHLLDVSVGRPVAVSELSDGLLNLFVDWLHAARRVPETIRNRRNAILSLWRAAAAEGLVARLPVRVRRVPVRRRIPEAWTWAEVQQLLMAALDDEKILPHGIGRGIFFASLISAAWDSALRLGDLLALRWRDVQQTPARIVQHKTGDQLLVSFSEGSRRLMQQCAYADGRRDEIWPLWGRREAFYRAFSQLVARAGIRPGTFKYLRRAAITDVEKQGGNGSLLAGHQSRGVTRRHYIDSTQLPGPGFRPRPLLP